MIRPFKKADSTTVSYCVLGCVFIPSPGSPPLVRFQGCSTGLVPVSLSSNAAATAGFHGMVFHSIDFGVKMGELLASVPAAASTPGTEMAPIVVTGGGKSAQDICAHLANESRTVIMVCLDVDAFTAGPKPLPGFIRKSR